jgi:oligopeptide transport system substrate-binding protein
VCRALCMIGPVVEEVGLRRMRVAVAVASLTVVAGLLAVTTAVAGCGGGDTGSDHVMVNGGEPQNPLIPTNTNETNGGRIWAKPQY